MLNKCITYLSFGDVDSYLNFLDKIKNFSPWTKIVMIFIVTAILFSILCTIYPSFKKGFVIVKEDIVHHKLGWKLLVVGGLFIFLTVIYLHGLNGEMEHSKNISNYDLVEKESDTVESFYPIAVDISNENKVGEWTYYICNVTDEASGITYPALFKYKGNDSSIRVSKRACYNYQIAKDSVFYLDSTISIQDHGELFVSRPDGKNYRILEEELHDFQIVDNEFIYYTYRHDTVGVGLEGHALHRMNLDGSDINIVTYEIDGMGISGSSMDFKVKGDWAYGKNYRVKLGSPATGLEKVELLDNYRDSNNDDWFYYTTNRLIKGRKDGTEQIELDGVDDFWYQIDNVDAEWIYYTKGQDTYKIRKDGTGKTITK